ncbi:hypothetical protein [Actimicrobium antarcticum]|uniref:Uncharacterized protein n=1 Tax=Actimicrobium antarcticum TaxID=1051899 RepID=A0ABP7SLF2_9BURK
MRFHRILNCLVLASIAFLTLPAHAFDRPFPANAKRGIFAITDYPQVSLDGKARSLAQGARIWSTDNLTVIPNALGSNAHTVNYTTDLNGTIDRVWLLSEQEAAIRRPANTTSSNQTQ